MSVVAIAVYASAMFPTSASENSTASAEKSTVLDRQCSFYGSFLVGAPLARLKVNIVSASKSHLYAKEASTSL